MEGFALEGAWLSNRVARANGVIYLRVGWPCFGFAESSAGDGRWDARSALIAVVAWMAWQALDGAEWLCMDGREAQ